MKKFFLIAVAACVALASCTKNEVAPTDPQEITYQAVVGKSTKAMIDNTAYPTNETFGTVAYKVKGGTSELYIPVSEVSFTDADTDYWSTATPYYWPKDGSTLTFYSYSPYKDQASVVIPVTSSADGLTITNYSVAGRQATDLMVADKVTGLTDNNVTIGGWKKGVSTIFRHKLAQVVAINFQTVLGDPAAVYDYAKGHDGSVGNEFRAGDKVYTVTDVTFEDIPEVGTYTNVGTEGWATGAVTDEISWITGNATPFSGGMFNTNHATNGYLLVIPQAFAAGSQKLTINYTVKTYTDASNFATETIEKTIDLKDLHDEWEMNKKYTYTISIGLNQIYWAPSVVAWDATGTGSATI